MNFFTNELQKIVKDGGTIHQPKFVGRECVGRLTNDITVKLSFYALSVSGNYDALKVRLINRHEGEIDSQLIRFGELWGKVSMHDVKKISPHAWDDGENPRWYGFTPTKEQYQVLSSEVKHYLENFTDLEQEEAESMGLSM